MDQLVVEGPAQHRTDRVYYLIAAALVAAGLVHVAVLVTAGGPWLGPVSYRKPATFGLSFGLTLATVTWVSTYVSQSPRARAWTLGALAAASIVEVVLITVQAWRGVPSHFNLSTTTDGLIARVLAAGGAVLIAVVAILTVAAWRRPRPGVSADMLLAVRAGFSLLSTAMLIGAAMIAIGVSRVIAGDQQAAYSAARGLKPGHGVALHAILVLPALAWYLARTGRPEATRLRVMRAAVVGYTVLTIGALVVSA